MNQAVANIMRRYRRAVIGAGIPLQDMLVFGSYAKGKARPQSDIDVAVISPAFGRDNLEERVRLMRLRRHISTAIEPHPLHPEDLENRWSTLAQEVKKYGIRLP